MSSYVWMKVLESAPERYDKGIALLSGGRVSRAWEAIAERVARPGVRVLDIGCGTGGAALACARRGADVVGIDASAGMLAVARRKAREQGLEKQIEWREISAAELGDHFPPRSFDAAVSCLAFSEMSPEERSFALARVRELLRPGGRVVVVDETLPPHRLSRLWYRLRRAPLVLVAWLIAHSTTRGLSSPGELLREAGFVEVQEISLGGALHLAEGRVPT